MTNLKDYQIWMFTAGILEKAILACYVNQKTNKNPQTHTHLSKQTNKQKHHPPPTKQQSIKAFHRLSSFVHSGMTRTVSTGNIVYCLNYYFMLQKSHKEAFYMKKQSSAPFNCSILRYCYFAWKLEIPSLMYFLFYLNLGDVMVPPIACLFAYLNDSSQTTVSL